MDVRSYHDHWTLDPSVTFLNHGSFGACPRAVLAEQQLWRARLEQEPVRFFALELEELLDSARQKLAAFVGASSDQLAFVPNATTGINTVLRSLRFQSGDELLTTNHEYNASSNALNFAAQQSGANVVVAEVPFPVESADQIVEAVLAKVSIHTKLVLLDHVSSQTALIFPIQTLIQRLATHGIDVLIDGAHAPGMVALNLQELGAAYYTGNCHKWLCAPKGSAFLYVRPDRQDLIRPLVISHGANSPRTDRSRFRLEFDWMGTSDPSPYLCIPAAIQTMESLMPGGWPAIMARNRSVALQVRNSVCRRFHIPLPCPDAMIGSMAVIPFFSGAAAALQTALFERFQIEIPVNAWGNCERLIRVSVQLYNNRIDYDVLADALTVLHTEEIKPKLQGEILQ
jgi:isopenicillin-N epimerase